VLSGLKARSISSTAITALSPSIAGEDNRTQIHGRAIPQSECMPESVSQVATERRLRRLSCSNTALDNPRCSLSPRAREMTPSGVSELGMPFVTWDTTSVTSVLPAFATRSPNHSSAVTATRTSAAVAAAGGAWAALRSPDANTTAANAVQNRHFMPNPPVAFIAAAGAGFRTRTFVPERIWFVRRRPIPHLQRSSPPTQSERPHHA
jgi:hypothetical protein